MNGFWRVLETELAEGSSEELAEGGTQHEEVPATAEESAARSVRVKGC